MSIAIAIIATHALITLGLIGWLVCHIRRELRYRTVDLSAWTQPLPRITVTELRKRHEAERYPETPAGTGRAPDRRAPAGSTRGGAA